METETYRKIGRGGAGNYYSKQDIEEAAKRAAVDLEAQNKPSATTLPDPKAVPQAEYVNSGRGGAGNFWAKGSVTSDNAVLPDVTPMLKSSTVAEARYSGRGGAGNYNTSTETERKRVEAETQEIEARNKAFEQVARDVEMGLKTPEKAHLTSERIE